ncbi:unnamed protein product [Ranitomeya imitator]|uniref:Uncharacterized protein n=1 Tax=Ranitomeya imitator TaxID=111125 RepID=A0ABN9MJ88_9NEOB|nr:unnamed protein product [Ranitomeya imitator]
MSWERSELTIKAHIKGGTSQINDLTVFIALCQITDLTYSVAGFTVPALSRLCEATSLPAGPGSAAILDPGLEQAGREDKFASPVMWLLLLVVIGLIFLYRWYRQSLILKNLTSKYVFITGCDTGFGNVLAKQLDKRGMKVLAACLTNEGAENLKKETSSRLQTIILDVTDSKKCKRCCRKGGSYGLWGLVNNAGCANANVPIEWQKKEDFLKILNVNLIGMVDVTVHLLHLVRKAQGRIVNVSSCMGKLANPCTAGYSMSKYGVEAFSDCLR